MRMHEVGADRRPPGRAREPAEHERQRQREVRPPTQVSGDPRAVGDSVVAEARRRDDLDLDATFAQVLDLVGDEEAGDVPGAARIGRRQDGDLQAWGPSRRSNTSGVASASRTSA